MGPSRGGPGLLPVEYRFKKTHSPLLGTTYRPFVSLKLVGPTHYVLLEDVLVDSGADVSVIPRDVGEALWADITRGKYVEIQGIVPSTKLIAYLHSVKMIFGPWTFQARIAVADSNNVPPVLGRCEALDRFLVCLQNGRRVSFSNFG